jgi:hypothetical protein
MGRRLIAMTMSQETCLILRATTYEDRRCLEGFWLFIRGTDTNISMYMMEVFF